MSRNDEDFFRRTLQPGERIRLRTGCGADTETDVYWCSPAGVWSNRGETVLLLSPTGAIAGKVMRAGVDTETVTAG